MAKVIVIYSTLASDMNYTNHAKGGADMPVELEPVFIKGGAGVANDRLITPMGVATMVTAEQLDQLRANTVFQMHEKNGYVIVSEERGDPEKMAAEMNSNDPSRPLNDQDLTKNGQVDAVTQNAPTSGKRR